MKRAFGPTGVKVSVIGQGTAWMGAPGQVQSDIKALLRGLDLGLNHIDTAEMYGKSEPMVGIALTHHRAIHNRRDEVFLVSKVKPPNASYAGTIEACEKSLDKLRVDYLDLYLLHYPEPDEDPPLSETMRAMEELIRQGKIRAIGISNFYTVEQVKEVEATLGKEPLACNQVEYSLGRRRIECSLLPYCQSKNIAIVGYGPLGRAQGRGKWVAEPGDGVRSPLPDRDSPGGRVLIEIAKAHDATIVQVVLAFLVHEPGTFTIPKAGRIKHVEENAGALHLRLTPQDVSAIDAAFPITDYAFSL